MDKKQDLGIKVSIFTLLIISFAMLFCPSVENVHADTSSGARNTGKSSVSVAINARIDLEITPSTTGALNYTTANFAVSTSQSDGFRVLVSGDSSALKRTAHPEEPGISSVTTATTLSALPNNTWGIYFGANNPTTSSIFLPITTTQTELVHNEVANASGTYKFAIAAKADTSLPAGYYSNQLVFSVIAEAPAITSLANATYMQDVTPEICSNSDLEVSYTLVDKRDDKPYKVAKLKDGNCWMQEDLNLTLSKDIPLTSEDSDITPNDDGGIKEWISPADYGSVNNIWYYYWNIATAGAENVENGIASDSICAKNWSLPTGDNFYNLISAYGIPSNSDSKMVSAPLFYNRSGYYYDGSVGRYGTCGYYWTNRTSMDNPYAVFILLRNNYPGESNGIYQNQSLPYNRGMSVRCVVSLE